MGSRNSSKFRAWLGISTLAIFVSASAASGEERGEELKRWNAGFLYGATKFYESDSHQSFGVAFRIRLSDRISLEPEFRYMSLPGSTFDSLRGRTERGHYDTLLAGNVVYDLLDPSARRFVPYVSAGAGWMRTTSTRSFTPSDFQETVPVFPPPSAPVATETRDSIDWLWFGGAFGVRILLPQGFFVSPEVNFGSSSESIYDLNASAVIKLGYSF